MTFTRANPQLDQCLRGKHLTQWDINLTRALSERGGNLLPLSDINISDTNGGALGNIDVHRQLRVIGRETLRYGIVTNASGQTLKITGASSALQGQIRRINPYLVSSAPRQHQVQNFGATKGDWMILIQGSVSIANVELYIDGSLPTPPAGNLIATLGTTVHCAAKIYFDGSEWRLSQHTVNVTPGPQA